eukprot:INCI5661.2.p1 GENE.INCI5661.2~~INCI5661.2.p1  ORF type:complete len:101 (-),score=8.53 INCI5661.2:203-505(-)
MLLAAKQLQSHQSPVTPGSFFILRKIRPLLYSHAQSLKLVKAHKPGHIDIRKLHHFLILRLLLCILHWERKAPMVPSPLSQSRVLPKYNNSNHAQSASLQ